MKGRHEEILAYLSDGYSIRQTANLVGVSVSAVRRVRKQYAKDLL
ncbi:helix-turn-helix domain-containing protein [Vibrio vulnificus]|nr:helix-turn-helix domain-containing protein [Vibrio vulnificus]